MPYNFSPFKNKAKEVEEWLARELSSIRTGRATPALLDGVMVESYGSRVPLKQVGAIAVSDPRSLVVTLWDKSQLRAVETAIMAANLGVSVAADTSSLRIGFPELTSEKRAILTKLAHDKVEQAKISLRQEREKVWNDIQSKEKVGELSEDEKFRGKDELQKVVDQTNKKFEELGGKKDKEIAS